MKKEEEEIWGCCGKVSSHGNSKKPCTKYLRFGRRYKGIVCDRCGEEVKIINKGK